MMSVMGIQPNLVPAFGAGPRSRLVRPSDGVMSRDEQRYAVEDVLLEAGIPKMLAQRFNARLWKIFVHPHFLQMSVDQVDHDTYGKLVSDPDNVAEIRAWVEKHRSEVLAEFDSRATEPEKLARWLKGNAKRWHQLDAFLFHRWQKDIAASLTPWFESVQGPMKQLLEETLDQPVSLSLRMVDTCCYAPCGDCLNGDPKSRKLWLTA